MEGEEDVATALVGAVRVEEALSHPAAEEEVTVEAAVDTVVEEIVVVGIVGEEIAARFVAAAIGAAAEGLPHRSSHLPMESFPFPMPRLRTSRLLARKPAKHPIGGWAR